MEGKQGSEGGTSSIFALTDGVSKKPLTRRSPCFGTKVRRLDAPETSKCLASFMPVGDEGSTAESRPRCGGGSAFALPSEALLPAEQRSWCSDTTNSCARYGLSAGRIRKFRSSKLVATLAVLLCFSFAGQAKTILHRSRGRLAPVIAISSSTQLRARTIGTAVTAMHIVSRPPSMGRSRHNAGGEGVSMPLRNPPSRNQRPPPTEGPRAMGDVGGAELSPTGSVSR